MHDHHIRDMVELLANKKVIKPEQQTQAISLLRKYWEDKIAVVWGVEDIIDRAKEQKKRIPKYKAREILQSMLHHHDRSGRCSGHLYPAGEVHLCNYFLSP